MHKKTQTRLITIILVLASISSGVVLVLYGLRENIVFFYNPSEAIIHKADKIPFRLGGFVLPGSLRKLNPYGIEFVVTDGNTEVTIRYLGIIPALFKEGQGAIVTGTFADDIFIASELLAKHDENYKPPVATH